MPARILPPYPASAGAVRCLCPVWRALLRCGTGRLMRTPVAGGTYGCGVYRKAQSTVVAPVRCRFPRATNDELRTTDHGPRQLLAIQNHVRERQRFRVRDRQERTPHRHRGGAPGRVAVEMEPWRHAAPRRRRTGAVEARRSARLRCPSTARRGSDRSRAPSSPPPSRRNGRRGAARDSGGAYNKQSPRL